MLLWCPSILLIEYIPLQQGLRHLSNLSLILCTLIEYIPLQQGLRLVSTASPNSIPTPHWVYSITTRIKTYQRFVYLTLKDLIEYIPLQQGLRLFFFGVAGFFGSHWVYSITTRIKTYYLFVVIYIAHWVYSITTRIKTSLAYDPDLQARSHSLSIFHYNKD